MRKGIVVLVAISVLSIPIATFAQQQSPQWAGTWKRNVAKSKYEPGPPPKTEQTVKLEIVNGQLRATTDGFNGQGQPTHTVMTVIFDGKEQPVTGAGQPTTRVYKRIDDRTYEGVTRVNGQVTTTTRYALAPDGKTHTLTTRGKNAQGQPVNNVVVYDRQ